MRTDTKTLFGSALMIALGFVIFELAAGWTLLGHWDAKAIVNNTAGALGQFLVYWAAAFLIVFISSVLFIAKASRALARQALVISSALVALAMVAISCVALAGVISLDSLPKTPMVFALLGGLYMIGQGVYASIHGFPEHESSKRVGGSDGT